MSKREALARAAYEAWAANKAKENALYVPFSWGELGKIAHEHWFAAAGALLAELREPGEKMLEKGFYKITHRCPDKFDESWRLMMMDMWQAMIDGIE